VEFEDDAGGGGEEVGPPPVGTEFLGTVVPKHDENDPDALGKIDASESAPAVGCELRGLAGVRFHGIGRL